MFVNRGKDGVDALGSIDAFDVRMVFGKVEESIAHLAEILELLERVGRLATTV
jgi:hypothetical protein